MIPRHSDKVYFSWIKIIKIIFWIIFCNCFALAMILQVWLELDDTFFDRKEISYYQGWTYQEDEKEIPVQFPTQIEGIRDKESVLIRNTLPNKIPDNYQLYICGSHQDMIVMIDGEVRESFDGRNARLIGTSAPSYYLVVELLEEDAGKEITVEYYTDIRRKAGFVGDILYGCENGFFYYLIKKYAHTLITAATLFIVGLCLIFFSLVTNVIFGKKQGFHYLGAFPMMIGLIIFTGSYSRQFFMTNLAAMDFLTYTGIDLCPIPLLCFLDELQQYRYKNMYVHLKTIFLGCYFVALLLHVNQIEDFASTVIGFHVLFAVAVLFVLGIFIYDYKKQKRSEIMESFVALSCSSIFVVFEIVSVDVNNDAIWGSYVTIGVLILLIIMSFTAVSQMQRREHESVKLVETNAAKSALLANVSHEIRTPINVMLGMNEMIIRESNSEEISGYAMGINDAGKALLYLINNMLDMTKIESGKMEIVTSEFNVKNFLENLYNMGRERSHKNKNQFMVKASPDVPLYLISDEQHIRQILINFISNAAKYTNEGTVTLEMCMEEKENSQSVVFTVSDTGQGIREEDQKKLFDYFTRVNVERNHKVEGTGLGLAISKELADLLHGKIAVTSVYGEGSSFRLTIPITSLSEKKDLLGEYIPGKRFGNTRKIEHGFIAPNVKILAVDDNSLNLEVIKSLLKRTGMEIDTAESGQECLDMICEKKYEIILLDHMMPEMDGIETIQRARERKDNKNRMTPYIAVTANAVIGAKELLLKNGFTDFVSKPIDWKELESVLKKYLPKDLVIDSLVDTDEPAFSEEELNHLEEILKQYDIHMDEGLHYTGDDIHQYARFLELFYHSYEKIKRELDESLERKEIDYYTVKVHALKGNAKSMGALDLFYTAQRMEKRGKQGDYLYLREAHYLLMLEMERAYNGAREFLDVSNLWEESLRVSQKTSQHISEEKMANILQQLKEYVEGFQAGEAIRLIQETRTYQLTEEMEKKMIQMLRLLEEMEYEQVEHILDDME